MITRAMLMERKSFPIEVLAVRASPLGWFFRPGSRRCTTSTAKSYQFTFTMARS